MHIHKLSKSVMYSPWRGCVVFQPAAMLYTNRRLEEPTVCTWGWKAVSPAG